MHCIKINYIGDVKEIKDLLPPLPPNPPEAENYHVRRLPLGIKGVREPLNFLHKYL